ncbi:hypothetical protein T02_5461 [Trichinella nativa]|uniref:Uncharacterized protein n=1 Tax=Trichinella nativa TaxID=6335 RepID=A0A0V1KXF6_9BILA|nr:hypothetical protein T02_5461 [Trichinella nativa]
MRSSDMIIQARSSNSSTTNSSSSSSSSSNSSGGSVALLLFRVELNCLDAGRLGQTKLDEANSDVMRLVSFGQPKRDRNPDVNSPQCARRSVVIR